MADRRSSKSRIVVETPQRYRRAPNSRRTPARNAEIWVAVSVIVAAAIATFFALFLTSRPFDPMTATLTPQQTVPAGPSFTPSPTASPTATSTPLTASSPSLPSGETSPDVVDDATIQSRIDKAVASDPVLANADVSTLVESGKVTIVGSVKSAELKQRVARTIQSVKGVTSVDNQLVITEATP